MRQTHLVAALAVLLTASLAWAEPPVSDPGPDSVPESRFDDIFDDFDDDGGYIDQPVGYPDPAEATNRGTLAFNRVVDKWLLDPVTEAYQFVLPTAARIAISRMFLNLSSTKILVNDLLQLEWIDASVTGARLVVNTTAGVAGLFDVAGMIGLEAHDSDFGQTLALAGTPSGPYIMLPVLGPSNVRDAFGTVIDGFFQPTYYILGPADLLIGPTEILLYSGSSGLSTRERHYTELKALEDSSIDFYAALRSGYYQDRVAEIWGRREDHRTTQEPVFTLEGFAGFSGLTGSGDADARSDAEDASGTANPSEDVFDEGPPAQEPPVEDLSTVAPAPEILAPGAS